MFYTVSEFFLPSVCQFDHARKQFGYSCRHTTSKLGSTTSQQCNKVPWKMVVDSSNRYIQGFTIQNVYQGTIPVFSVLYFNISDFWCFISSCNRFLKKPPRENAYSMKMLCKLSFLAPGSHH